MNRTKGLDFSGKVSPCWIIIMHRKGKISIIPENNKSIIKPPACNVLMIQSVVFIFIQHSGYILLWIVMAVNTFGV